MDAGERQMPEVRGVIGHELSYARVHTSRIAVLSSLLKAAAFSPRSLQFPNAWVGHVPFAMWLIRAISPSTLVELGTYSGNSYFSFCQAVIEADTATRCFAVDTWQGDEHTGHYREDVFSAVSAHHQQHYAAFSRLLRMPFDDAVACFSDESIDLLHIDGLHTYEAVQHDFDTWLPKLAPGAVVLIHDTNVRERNFGVWKFWEELRAIYPRTLEFVHSHGLGVLQLNDAPAIKQLAWLEGGSPDRQSFIRYFGALGARQLDRYDSIDLKRRADGLDSAVAELHRQIASVNLALAARDQEVATMRTSTYWRIAARLRRLRSGLLGTTSA
jgi:predicted O-methyltransferase YrrM